MKISFFLSLCTGLLLSLGFLPSRFFWVFSWFGFLPLFSALVKVNSKLKAFFLGYLAGLLFWLITVYWLIHVSLLGLILLSLYLSFYFGIFGLFFYIFFKKEFKDIFFIPSFWVILEYIRSKLFTGFGWALLGYSQTLNLTLIQIADLFGAEALSFLIMATNLTVFFGSFALPSQRLKAISVCLGMLIFSLLYGNYKKIAIKNFYSLGIPFKVAVVQANIPQFLKWDSSKKDFILQRHFTLTKEVLKDNPEIIVWPEASLPVVVEEEPIYYLRLLDFIKGIKKPLLLGLVTKEDTLYYNCAEFISSDAEPLKRYHKLHLVPFGEYIPLKKIFYFLENIAPIGDFSKGKEYSLFEIKKDSDIFKFSVLICFEDIFPELSYRF
ncbi:MAG: apolipoprotein N-acyltransferase, partial [Candidatus Omnitrophica bacterium]|nr:apolipoprotein N-acyltransferase [Candidatus Omnitrophota bacterium]